MTLRARQEWARRVAAEYSSAAVAADVLADGIRLGLPPDLLLTATRIVRDELDHARLSHEVLVAIGGDDEPIDLGAEALARTGDLLERLVRDFCLGESFAVPYFAEMRRRCTHPTARPVLDRVLEDEAVHRAFGWDTLDALLEREPGVADRVTALLPALLASFRGYASPPDAPPLAPEERACGLLEHAEYAALYERTWREDLRPRFLRRGIAAPA